MKRAVRTRWSVGAAVTLAMGASLIAAGPAAAHAASSSKQASSSAGCQISHGQVQRAGASLHLGGIAFVSTSAATGHCYQTPSGQPAFNGTPPLLFHGNPPDCAFKPCANGNMMMAPFTSPLVVVPIFWTPPGYSVTPSYENLIVSYLRDVAAASGTTTNVFSVMNQYTGNNGQINYNVTVGPVLSDTDPLTSGCNLTNQDRSGIYADGSGYSACVDDAQIRAEVDKVSTANGLPHDLSHIYVLYLPKQVESCFKPGKTTSTGGGQACTINHEPTAAYCAYHSYDSNSAVYADMAYPIYASPVGYTCGSDAVWPTVQSPNGNPDADTEISATSHEISEAITDPDVQTGWMDSSGNEIGDDCAYIYGHTQGAPGRVYNQVINGQSFLTQEEFSNSLFASSGGQAGCAQSA